MLIFDFDDIFVFNNEEKVPNVNWNLPPIYDEYHDNDYDDRGINNSSSGAERKEVIAIEIISTRRSK
ncbi:unnamed protein product, partial [Dovyalis caffra]